MMWTMADFLISHIYSLHLSVRVEFQPKFQVGLLGSTVHMFCHANVSHFSWKVIHLQFKNSSSSLTRLITVLQNNTNTILGNEINATVYSNDATVNISYILNINDESMVCSMDGEYSCEIEFTDDTIQSTSDKGTLSVTGIFALCRFDFSLCFASFIQVLDNSRKGDIKTFDCMI